MDNNVRFGQVNMKRKVALVIGVLLVMATLYSAWADNVILDNATSNVLTDLIFYNNDTQIGGTLIEWDMDADNGLPENASITDANLCVYIVKIYATGLSDDDVRSCRITTAGLSEEVSIDDPFLCTDYNVTDTSTLSNTTVGNWACFDVTNITRDWADVGTGNLGIRFEDPDLLVDENDSNDHYIDEGTLTIGNTDGTGSIDFEDRENTNGTSNTPYLNITYYNNTAPVLENITITTNDGGLNRSNCTLTANYDCYDNDGDLCNATVEYNWYNDAGVIIGPDDRTLNSSWFSKGDNISAWVKIYDNSSASNDWDSGMSAYTYIENTPPSITINSFKNLTRPYINGTYQVNITWYDFDLDTPVYPTPSLELYWATNASGNTVYAVHYNLTNGSTVLSNLTLDSATRSNLGVDHTDYLYIKNARGYDGSDWGVKKNSTEINFTNAPPDLNGLNMTVYNTTTSSYENNQLAYTDSNLSVEYDANDLESPMFVRFQWFNDSGAIPGETTGWLTYENFSKHDNITCEVELDDDEGGVTRQNVSITIQNSLPVIDSASIAPDPAVDTDNLTCNNGTVSDTDGDALTLEYDWFKDGVLQSGLTAKTIGSGNISGGEDWYCKINVTDGDNYSGAVTSQTVSVNSTLVAPTINYTNATTALTGITSDATNPTRNDSWVNLSVTFDDGNTDEAWTAYFCKTDSFGTSCGDGEFCHTTVNSTVYPTVSCRYDLENETLSSRNYYVYVIDNTSRDQGDGSGTAGSFHINHPPTVPSITTPTNDTWITVNHTFINYTSTDSDSDTITYYIYTDTISNPTNELVSTTNTTYNWTGLNETTYYIRILANDSHGYESLSDTEISIKVDYTVPSVYNATLSGTSLFTSDTQIVKVYCTDNNSGVNTSTVTYNITDIYNTTTNETMTVDNGSRFTDTYALWGQAGNYYLDKFWCYDQAGNLGTLDTNLNFTVSVSSGTAGGGGGDIDVTYPAEATFTTVPAGQADVLATSGDNVSFDVSVISTSASDVFIKLRVRDECDIYTGYEGEGEETGEYYKIEPYDRKTWTLNFNLPDDFEPRQCSVIATFVAKDGSAEEVEIRVWNTFWTGVLRAGIRVITYPIVFDTEANSVKFLTRDAFAVFPSAVDLTIPMFGLAFLVFTYFVTRFLLYRYIVELRSKNNRLLLFVITMTVTVSVALLISFPIGFGFAASSMIYGILFVGSLIAVGVAIFTLPSPR